MLCSLILVVCTTCVFAHANDMSDLPPYDNAPGPLMVGNFALNGPCTGGNNCNYFLGDEGGDGGHASGSGNFNANFSGTAQIAYSFVTARSRGRIWDTAISLRLDWVARSR